MKNIKIDKNCHPIINERENCNRIESDFKIISNNRCLGFYKPCVKNVQFLELEGTLEHPSF